MLCTPADRGDEGYVYVFPMPIGAALYSFRNAALSISDLAATLAGLQPSRYDTNGWLCYRSSCDIDRWYKGDGESDEEFREELESRHEVMRWYFQREKERWVKEASMPRKYVAFRSDERDDNDGRMLVLGERMRPIDERVYRNRAYVQESMQIRERVTGHLSRGLIAAIAFNDESERVYDVIYSCITGECDTCITSPRDGVVDLKVNANTGGTLFFPFRKTETGLELSRIVLPRVFNDEGHEMAYLQREITFAIIQEMLIERGVREALNNGLIESDEKNGRTVPLDRDELSAESYLSLGLDWLETVCREAIAAAPAAEVEAEEAADELADWERELLGLDEED